LRPEEHELSPPLLSAVRRDALAELAYEAIKERIIDQHYAPGEPLRAEETAIALGVSATPVREALSRLWAERLVVRKVHQGFAVAPELDLQRYSDLFDTCTWLQVRAIELGATTITSEELAEMRRILAGMDSAWQHRGYDMFRLFHKNDSAFHSAVMRLSRNSFLPDLWDDLNPTALLTRLYYRGFTISAVPTTEVSAEHHAIVDALATRDPASVRHAVVTHHENSKQRWLKLAGTLIAPATEPNGPRSPTELGRTWGRGAGQP
jgi:DNA-binding GntR family transcriptional regulator